MNIPDNYLEKVYSGILGKLIGVYLGRPFEGWTFEKIINKLGPINYYVNKKFKVPLVVTDDDISGTFTFVRAVEDSIKLKKITSKDIANTWLNYIIENRTIFWWGGNGISTEHTAWLNLKNGIPPPQSGSIKKNGKIIAEQIGAQIFIDAWALVSPGNPSLAAELAKKASRVSHDGEAVYAAQLWAAMESEAFVSDDVDHLINTGLSVIPKNSMIFNLVQKINFWHKKNKDWYKVRKLIYQNFGYDKFPGNCHIIPNHAIMIMSLLYSRKNFHLGQKIVNTSGWDTDCNAGNLGCLQGIMSGLEGINSGPDWRTPISDSMIISSADGGYSINDAVRMTYYIANLGKKISGEKSYTIPKNKSKFHFTLPGSTQGFKISKDTDANCSVSLKNINFKPSRALELSFTKLSKNKNIIISTPTFINTDVLKMRTYDLMATPLIYPGQKLKLKIFSGNNNNCNLDIFLRIKYYGDNNKVLNKDSNKFLLRRGSSTLLKWSIPECNLQPISEICIVAKSKKNKGKGKIIIDYLTWDGSPNLILKRPKISSDFWHRAWINGADNFLKDSKYSYTIAQNSGLGLISYGNRDWKNYKVISTIIPHLGKYFGLIARFQGMRRFYAVRLNYVQQIIEIIRVFDDEISILKSVKLNFNLGENITINFEVSNNNISAKVREKSIKISDNSKKNINCGGIGLLVFEGSVSTDLIKIS